MAGTGSPSPYKGFYKRTSKERRNIMLDEGVLSEDDLELMLGGGLDPELAEKMVENCVGVFPVPLGIATGLLLNGKEMLVPMATEETSVIAAASNGARLCRSTGGVAAEVLESLTIGQIHVMDVGDHAKAALAVKAGKEKLLSLANSKDPFLVKIGGGAKDIRLRLMKNDTISLLTLHLLVDTRDAMGANAVNTMLEAIAPTVEDMTGGRAVLRIISNLSDRRVARARAVWKRNELGVEPEKLVTLYEIARLDPYRCATHNKGVMNGVSALVLATGNDTRAVEAAAHSYSFRDGRPTPLTRFEVNDEGDLAGEISLPFPVGVVGGAASVHPLAGVNRKLLGVESADELGMVMAALGLVQNLAALRALAGEGIQKGHMRLHARNAAISAGAGGDEVEKVAALMVKEGRYDAESASEALSRVRKERREQ